MCHMPAARESALAHGRLAPIHRGMGRAVVTALSGLRFLPLFTLLPLEFVACLQHL